MPGMTKHSWAFVLGILALAALPAWAAEEPAEAPVKVEVTGTLETGIVAIGGETTGTVIRAGNVTWELDLSGDPKLAAQAEKLNKMRVVVTGSYSKKKGVEIPERHIVKVKTLKSAPQ